MSRDYVVDQDGRKYPRRQVIKAGIASGCLAFLAGCAGDDDDGNATETDTPGDGDDDATPEPSDEVYDVQFNYLREGIRGGENPQQIQFNPWNPSNLGNAVGGPGRFVLSKPMEYIPSANRLQNIHLANWDQPDDTTVEAEFDSEWTWHNGDPVVVDDYIIHWDIRDAVETFGADTEPLVNEREKLDDHSLRIHLNTPLSEPFSFSGPGLAHIHAPPSRGIATKHDMGPWADWHESLTEGDQNEVETTLEELTTTAVNQIPDTIGNGMWEPVEVGDTELVMERYDDHVNADLINYERLRFHYVSDAFQAYVEEVGDAGLSYPVEPDLQDQIPEETRRLMGARTGNSLISFGTLGHRGKATDRPVIDRNVRAALCHLFDRGRLAPILTTEEIFEFPPCRVPGPVLENGNGPVDLVTSELIDYADGVNEERATELLEEAGYEQDNDEWYTPDGERFELLLAQPEESAVTQVCGEMWEEYGIATNVQQFDDATFGEMRDNGEYDMYQDGSSANGIAAMWDEGLVIGWLTNQLLGMPDEFDVPMPIGDPEGSNGTKTINVEEHILDWKATGDDQYYHELIWWWNYFVPQCEVAYSPGGLGVNMADWELNMGDTPEDVLSGPDETLALITGELSDAALQYDPSSGRHEA